MLAEAKKQRSMAYLQPECVFEVPLKYDVNNEMGTSINWFWPDKPSETKREQEGERGLIGCFKPIKPDALSRSVAAGLTKNELLEVPKC
jgi:hypothetical protein